MACCPFSKNECEKEKCQLWVEVDSSPGSQRWNCAVIGILRNLERLVSVPNEILGALAKSLFAGEHSPSSR